MYPRRYGIPRSTYQPRIDKNLTKKSAHETHKSTKWINEEGKQLFAILKNALPVTSIEND
eukprot:m.209875 g.209875  ORF g.209875 m.209875 type:complete len:60 (-) comp15478_c1_seq3:1957-2136(-)